jgi:thiol-disulfide isomerase/thioredoxin
MGMSATILMKFTSIICLALAVGLFGPSAASGQTTNAAPVAPPPSLSQLMQQIMAKVNNGLTSESDFKDELAMFPMVIARDQAAHSEETAEALWTEAILYLRLFSDYDKCAELARQIPRDYPQSAYAQEAASLLAYLNKQLAARQIQDRLAVGTLFPDFSATNLQGGPLSARLFKGKVVLVDFWATWCQPCQMELPLVTSTFQKYHTSGFEIIGVSLDSKREDLTAFLQQKSAMTWPQYFDGLGWTNQLVLKYGVTSIPCTLLIGPNGKIIAKNVHGQQLADAVAEAMAMK